MYGALRQKSTREFVAPPPPTGKKPKVGPDREKIIKDVKTIAMGSNI